MEAAYDQEAKPEDNGKLVGEENCFNSRRDKQLPIVADILVVDCFQAGGSRLSKYSKYSKYQDIRLIDIRPRNRTVVEQIQEQSYSRWSMPIVLRSLVVVDAKLQLQ